MVVAHDVMLYMEMLRGVALCHCFDSCNCAWVLPCFEGDKR
jgi:hypothetical protein